jgi:hypothetical protein
MAGKDTKAALLLALAPKEGDSPVKSGEDESEGDTDSEDLAAAMRDKDGAALKAVIRRIAMGCMSEESDEGEG